uniref:Uncharacterized protein n=1 Tax=Oryza rufipogon TaxID=4529 RepID=A0A0E0MUA6_ORYRU
MSTIANRTEAITVGELFAQLVSFETRGSNYDSLAFTVACEGFDRRQGGDCMRPRTQGRKVPFILKMMILIPGEDIKNPREVLRAS